MLGMLFEHWRRGDHFIREADRAEAETWSIKMEGYGGPSRLRPIQLRHGALNIQLQPYDVDRDLAPIAATTAIV
jgi:hypothetical protein